MAEHNTAASPVEERALSELASLDAVREERSELAELARTFDAAIEADLGEVGPLLIIPGANALTRAAQARLTRVTLRVLAVYGRKGVRLDLLKRIFQALEAPPALAELIERKLTADHVGSVSAGRLYFAATPETRARLAQTRAE